MSNVWHRIPCCRSKWELKHGKGGGEKKDPFFMKITYLGDGDNPVNFLLKKVDAFGDRYSLDESSINKMTLDGSELTFENLTLSNLGLYGGTYDVYQYNFGDNSLHELIIYSDSLETLRFSPWSSGPPASSSNYFKDITKIEISNNITSICNSAFKNCNNLSEIIFPDTIMNIGRSAFDNTEWNNQLNGLIYINKIVYKYIGNDASLTLLEGTLGIADEAFRNCSSLVLVEIPNSVTSIGNSAFAGCKGLSSITIPNSVTRIGNSVFYQCSGLTSIDISNSVISIEYGVFEDCTSLTSVTIPNSVTSIRDSVFSGCSGLTSITIPNSVTNIGNSVFSDCTNLASITISNSVTSIGSNAFNNCVSLASITIPNSITNIFDSTFSGCKGLSSITIPNSVTTISNNAFFNCNGLTSITIPNSVIRIDGNAFGQCSSLEKVIIEDITAWCNISFNNNSSSNPLTYAHHLYNNDVEITNLIIPDDITNIGNYTFSGYTGLITIPNNVTSIGDYAFHGCSNLTSITIPNSVTRIGNRAFADCRRLTSITIPNNSTTYIDSAILENCSALKSITCNAMTAPSISNSAFLKISTNGTLYVPIGSSGYDIWMQNTNYYLGKYYWTKVEQ